MGNGLMGNGRLLWSIQLPTVISLPPTFSKIRDNSIICSIATRQELEVSLQEYNQEPLALLNCFLMVLVYTECQVCGTVVPYFRVSWLISVLIIDVLHIVCVYCVCTGSHGTLIHSFVVGVAELP